MFDRFLKKAEELTARGETFAVAVVVRQEGPGSGKPGDKAIVTADGKLWGWVGGGCTQPVVIKEAREAMKDGRTRLIRISPTGSRETAAGILEYKMTCHSGGALDIFIEPVTAKPRILILGRSPVARTLCRLAATVNFAVSVAAPEAAWENFPDADAVAGEWRLKEMKIAPQTFIVVSTQGEQDEEALEQALETEAEYIAFVASRTKAEKILKAFAEGGASEESLKRVRAPAGLAIRAKSPEEIAVSILAEIIQVKANRGAAVPREAGEAKLGEMKLGEGVAEETTDPICGMTVMIVGAKYTSEYKGHRFYFCCGGCKQAFEREPERYAGAGAA
jgi:xanthine dehydrogenase accessory factor